MFLDLKHKQLEVYKASKAYVLSCYKITNDFPPNEKFAMTSQVRRAALSTHLNISEGASRKSIAERRRFYEISRGSMVEVDAAMDIADELGYLKSLDLNDFRESTIQAFKLLSGLINHTS